MLNVDLPALESTVGNMNSWLDSEYPTLVSNIKSYLDDQIAYNGEGKAWIGQTAGQFIDKIDENIETNFNNALKQDLITTKNALEAQIRIFESVYRN